MNAPRPPYWVCAIRTPTCRKYHPYLSYKENARGSIIDYRGVSGWLLYTCGTCRTHSLGIQDAPSELLHMYAIDDAQLEIVKNMPRTTKAWVLLEFLGYMSARDAEAATVTSGDPLRESTGLE